jgi:putative FmdB family regulatory protein
MPKYEFRCTNIECAFERFEIWSSIKEKLEAVCPNCGKPAERVFSIFHGKFGDTGRFHGR